MTIQLINTGTNANSGNGDSIRAAFNKVNSNFSFLSTATFSGNGSTSIDTGVAPPMNPTTGDLWYDTTSGRLYIYYDSNWIDSSPAAGTSGANISTGDTPPVGAELGDLWYDTNSGRMYVFYDGGWVDASPPSVLGPTGPSGPSGPSGGPAGAQGPTGPTGTAGINGLNGLNGTDGAVGPQGPQGPQGVQGDLGPTGPAGVSNVPGPTGPIGDSGIYTDSTYNAGAVSGPTSFDRSLGTVQLCTLQGNLEITGIANANNGDNFTIIATQDYNGGRLLTVPAGYKFASGVNSLSTTPFAVDMINMMFIGTTTYVALTTGYV